MCILHHYYEEFTLYLLYLYFCKHHPILFLYFCKHHPIIVPFLFKPYSFTFASVTPTLPTLFSFFLLKQFFFTCTYFRLQRKVTCLDVYRDGDWLRFEGMRNRYDSINTLVMHRLIVSVPIPIGDHKVIACLRYPVHSSKYYK